MRKIILLTSFSIFIIFIFYLINKDYKSDIHPFLIDLPKVVNVAHRGGMGIGPENTIFTFKKAIKVGVDILEMDIHSTSDSIIVLLHDNKVNRTTNGFGNIWDYSLQELLELNAGYYWTEDDSITFPYRFLEIKIPTLDQVFKKFNNIRLNIEIKNGESHIINNLCNMIYDNNMEEKVLIGSFEDEVIEDFRKVCPYVATSSGRDETKLFFVINYLYLDFLFSPSFDVFELPQFYNKTSILTERFIVGSDKKNIPIYVWTINDKKIMKNLIKIGIKGIITDFPDSLSEILN